MRRLLFLPALTVALAPGCARDPLLEACPQLRAGDLVVTEIRGAQSGSDALGQWVEIENTTSRAVDLDGLTMRFQKLDGSAVVDIVVRAPRPVAAGDFAVLGKFAEGEEPGYVTYGFADDFSSNLYSAGAIDLRACDLVVDHVFYDSLPALGTYSLDAHTGSWCANAAGTGHPGTPLERNPACAP